MAAFLISDQKVWVQILSGTCDCGVNGSTLGCGPGGKGSNPIDHRIYGAVAQWRAGPLQGSG